MNWGAKKLYEGMSSAPRAAMSLAKKATVIGGMMSAGGSVEHDFRGGGHVKATTPKEKAVKSGNSYANDKVKALLSEGEIVLPKTVTESADPVRSAADFVSKVIAKRKAK